MQKKNISFYKCMTTKKRRGWIKKMKEKLQSDPGNKCHWHAQIESKAVSTNKKRSTKCTHFSHLLHQHQLFVVCYFFAVHLPRFRRKSNGIQWIVMNIMQILSTNVSIFFFPFCRLSIYTFFFLFAFTYSRFSFISQNGLWKIHCIKLSMLIC